MNATQPILLVGYSLAWQQALAKGRADGSVLFVEEPDVVRKRDVAAQLQAAGPACVLCPWEYQLPGAADRFFLAHRDLRPAAILPGVEYAVAFAARLAERYGVPGATSGAAALLTDKHLLRTVTREAGIANPRSERVDSPDDVRRFIAAHGAPVVLKPANRQASVGTQILHDAERVDAAWAECTQQDEGVYAPDRPRATTMLVEQYVAGHELSVELLVRDGVALFANVTEKHLFPGPRPVELGHALPAPIDPALTALLLAQTERVLAAVGFGSGFAHCEWIVADGVPHLVECAGRMPGDCIVPLIDRAWGVDLVAAFEAVMRGDEIAPLPTVAPGGAASCFVRADAGEVISVGGVEQARAIDGVTAADVLVGPGDRTHGLRSSWDRVGYVTSTAATARVAFTIARAAAAAIRVDVAADGAPAVPSHPADHLEAAR